MAAARVQLWPLDAGELAADCTAHDWLVYFPAGADLAEVGRAASAHLSASHPAASPAPAALLPVPSGGAR